MLVIMRSDSTVEQVSAVEDAITRMGFKPLPVPGANRTAICITGNKEAVDPGLVSRLSESASLLMRCRRASKAASGRSLARCQLSRSESAETIRWSG